MKRIRPRGLAVAIFLTAFAGCSGPPDERLSEMAQQTMAEQSRQNQRMADQSEAIVAESHQIAEAAKDLVQRDAESSHDFSQDHRKSRAATVAEAVSESSQYPRDRTVQRISAARGHRMDW